MGRFTSILSSDRASAGFQSPLLPPRALYPTSDGGGRVVERIQPDDGGPCAAAIVGLPFDAAIPTRPGARRGPDAFRTALTRFSADQGSSQWPVGSRITDLGDVDLRNLGVADAHDRVLKVLSGVLDRVDCLIAIGGDQSLSFPVFRALVDARGGSWGLISLDAHHDVRPYSRDSISSGTSMRRALELGALSPKQLIQIGIRPFANSAVHRAWCEERGVGVYDVATVRARGIGQVAQEALERATLKADRLYVSVDLDVIDQAQAPGTSAAGPGGLSVSEVLQALDVWASSPMFYGGDIMELSPRWDWGDETARVAARAFLAIASARWPVAIDKAV